MIQYLFLSARITYKNLKLNFFQKILDTKIMSSGCKSSLNMFVTHFLDHPTSSKRLLKSSQVLWNYVIINYT